MNMFMRLLIYLFGYFITSQMILVSGEYSVKDVVPSYLFKKFDNVRENIFPQSIRMKVSLSRIEGTLLYTIDRNMNQMIVTLQDDLMITLGIEFRKKEIFITIPELCNCQRCRFETLDIRIVIKDEISVQCNTGKIKSSPYDKNIVINRAFNIPKYTSTNTSSSNEGYLWMVNTPYDTVLYPNPQQLSGCIFDVWYNNKPISFNETVGKITDKCPRYCKGDICNGGECFETYNGRPVCNCTKAFLNGEYCNKTISRLNIRSMQQVFHFSMFKVSWNSSSNEILRMSCSKFIIQLRTSGRLLKLEYLYGKDYHVNITSILSERYKRNKRNLLIVIFQETFMDIHYFNGSWSMRSVSSVLDLSKEKITSISLQSGDGQIGLAYKNNPKFLAWNIVDIKDYEEIKLSLQSEMKITKKISDGYIALIVILAVIFIFLIVGAIIFSRYYKRRQNRRFDQLKSCVKNQEEHVSTELQNLRDFIDDRDFSSKQKDLFKELIKNVFEDSEKEFSQNQKDSMKKLMEEIDKDTGKEFSPKQLDSIKELMENIAQNTGKEFSSKQMYSMKKLIEEISKNTEKEFSKKQQNSFKELKEDIVKKDTELIKSVLGEREKEFSPKQKDTIKELMENIAKDTEFSPKQLYSIKELMENIAKNTEKEFSKKQEDRIKELMEDIAKKEFSTKQEERMKKIVKDIVKDAAKELAQKQEDLFKDLRKDLAKDTEFSPNKEDLLKEKDILSKHVDPIKVSEDSDASKVETDTVKTAVNESGTPNPTKKDASFDIHTNKEPA